MNPVTEDKTMLKVSGLNAFYGRAQILYDVELEVGRGEVVALPLAGIIDLSAERARLAKEMAKADADIARVDAKLGNPNFVARAPEEIIEEEKDKREEAQLRKSKLAEALERLKGAA